MECTEAREQLFDLNRGRLEAEAADAVRAHVGQCPACADALQAEVRVRALVQAEAPRYSAPPELAASLRTMVARSARPHGGGWWDRLRAHPWMVGSLAGATAVLVLAWAVGFWPGSDPVSRLVGEAVKEHVEYAEEMMDWPVPDPQEVLRSLRSQVRFEFEPVFVGDARIRLVAALATDLRGRPAAAFIYRDAGGKYSTLFLMPEGGIVIPAEGRKPIETFKPHHRVAASHHMLLWKQRGLACLLVSDLDEPGLADMFLKIRTAA